MEDEEEELPPPDGLKALSSMSRMRANPLILMNTAVLKAAEKDALQSNRAVLVPRLFSYRCDTQFHGNLGMFTMAHNRPLEKSKTDIIMSQSNKKHIVDNTDISCIDYLDWLKYEMEEQIQMPEVNTNSLTMHDHSVAHSSDVFNDEKFLETGGKLRSSQSVLAATFGKIYSMFAIIDASFSDLEWEHELQQELNNILFVEYISDLQNELRTKLTEQRTDISTIGKNWDNRIAILTAVHNELNSIYKLLSNLFSVSHHSHDRQENLDGQGRINKNSGPAGRGQHQALLRDDVNREIIYEKVRNFREPIVIENPDYRQFDSMAKEEIVNYYRNYVANLKRQHELTLHERTEEIFELKRTKGLLNPKTISELESLRKKVPEVILKLDEMLLKVLKTPQSCSEFERQLEIGELKGEIGLLRYENRRLRGLLEGKAGEAEKLSYELSEARNKLLCHSSAVEELSRNIENMKDAYQELLIKDAVKDEVYETTIRRIHEDHNCMKDKLTQEWSGLSSSNMAISKFILENSDILSGQEKGSAVAIEEDGLTTKLAAEIRYVLQDENSENDYQSSDVYVDQSDNDMRVLVKIEPSDLLSSYDHLQRHEVEIIKSNQMICYDSLEDAKKTCPGDMVQEKEMLFSSDSGYKEQQTQKFEYVKLITDWSRKLEDIEDKLVELNAKNPDRLQNLDSDSNKVVQQSLILVRQGLLYKEMSETSLCGFQMAESKDCDQVHASVSRLQKMHVILDHYHLIYEKHPGLLEALLKTCKLVVNHRSSKKESNR